MNPFALALGYTGRAALNSVHTALQVSRLITDTLSTIVLAPFRGASLRARYTLLQFVEFGAHSVPIVSLISFLIGAILAMQSSYQLERFGVEELVANLVAVAAVRELAPLITAVIITGRSGSAITAEIGTMKVGEELAALNVMGIGVTRFLVVPKFIGMLFAVPMVTLISMFVMIMGGWTLSITWLDMPPVNYLDQSASAIQPIDLSTGMTKSVFFALVIAWVGVWRGFQVEGGAEGVGQQTTSSVVTSIFLVIIVDLIFTALFFTA